MTDTVGDVVRRLREIQESVHPRDGVGQFNRVYLRVTEAVRDRLGGGFFDDPRFVAHLQVVFAGRYFAAVDADAAGKRADSAWMPLFAARDDGRVQPVQFAVAGMNAHINHDLSLALVDTCRALRTHPAGGHVPEDYRRVNLIIEDVESQARRSLLSELERELGEPLEPVTHLVSAWSIAQAREAAWVRTQVLWLLRDTRWLFDHHVDSTARAIGMTSRHLLTPVPVLPHASGEVA